MKKKINYYDISNILKTNAQYMILLGQRANGKSYQAKETTIEGFIKNGSKFVYLRRWKADLKVKAINEYFEDMPISKMTSGEWEIIDAWNGSIYLAKHDDEGKTVRGAEIGRYCALNEYERYKSRAFVGFSYILFEEFITDSIYLDNEPTLLQQFVSTVARLDRLTVLLIGNTLTRVCPYFAEWSLDGVLKQKQGTIEVYHYHVPQKNGEDSVIDIAVENCTSIDTQNKMFFGQPAKQIISGEWDTKSYPRLPKKQSWYEKVYEIKLEYQKFIFVIELLIEPKSGGALCFIYPFTGNRRIDRLITDVFSDDIYTTNSLILSRRPERLIHDCIIGGKVAYSDNLTATDFNNILLKFKWL